MADIFKALNYWVKMMVHNKKTTVKIPTDCFFITDTLVVYTKIGVNQKWIEIRHNRNKITVFPTTSVDLPPYLSLTFNKKKIDMLVRRVQDKLDQLNDSVKDVMKYMPVTEEEVEEALFTADPMYISDLDCYYERDALPPLFNWNEDFTLTQVNEKIV